MVVTAHWAEAQPTISSGAQPKLYFDYGGFPPESYRLKYDAPGSPNIATEIKEAFEQEGFKPALNNTRGKFLASIQSLRSFVVLNLSK